MCCLHSREFFLSSSCRAIKTMLAESCDANTQARGMSYLNLGWGCGNILGPVIGGFLAQPCDRWPNFPLCNGGQGLFAKQCAPSCGSLLPCMHTLRAPGFWLSSRGVMEDEVSGGFLAQPCDCWPSFPLCNGGQGLFAKQCGFLHSSVLCCMHHAPCSSA